MAPSDDLQATRERLSAQLGEAIASDPLRALSSLADLQRDVDGHLREAVRAASAGSSWAEIAKELSVSKQAAHQRFKAYAHDAARDIKTQHKAMKRARRAGDVQEADAARARRDELVSDLKTKARALKDA